MDRVISAARTLLIFALFTLTVAAQVPDRCVVKPFPQQQIALTAGTPFKVAETRVTNYLTAINMNNFLYAFRQTYGLPINGMSPCGVWEAPDCNLRGHATGHLLSALSLNYAATKNSTVRNKMQQLIRGLDTCQRLATNKGFQPGCLSAFGESLFTALENGGTYGGNPNVWAPWYSQHKILAGLISCYQNAGDTVALRVAKSMGTWAYNRLSKLSNATLQSMWTRYIAGEYGGYNEAASQLYLITGDTTYRALARLFDENTSNISLSNLAANTDRLGGEHANQLMPRIVGYLKNYDATGTANYLNAATNFWDMVDGHHRFAFGGVTRYESFLNKDAIAADIQIQRSNETCASYNLVKLSRDMFLHKPLAKYMDYWERANTAQLLANANVAGAAASDRQPFACYMTNVKCGDSKAQSSSGDSYDIGDLYGYTCCDGTGLESHVRYTEGIYGHDGDTLYISQFIASTLSWPEKSKTIAITSTYPASDTVTITVTGAGSMPLKIRSPWWIRRSILIWVDGTQRHIGKIPPSSYFKLDATRGWSGSGTVKLVLPQTLRCEVTPDDATKGNVFYGGQALYGVTSVTSFQTLNCGTFVKGAGLTWTASGFTFKPYYNVASDHYSLYWNVTNIPANWKDTVLDTQDDPVNVVETSLLEHKSAGPVLSLSGSRIAVTFGAPVEKGEQLRVRLFNARGVNISDLRTSVRQGERSLSLRHRASVLPAGIYACVVDVGDQRYRSHIACSR